MLPESSPLRPDPTPPGASGATSRVRRATWVGLALITLLALAVRLHGIAFLSPHLMEPDGLVVDYQMRVIDGRGSETPDHAMHAFYPHLLARVASLVPSAWVAPSHPRTLEEHLRAAGAIRMRARIAVVLLSLLAIPLTWLLARRFLPDPWPLLAAAFTAASPFVMWFAQQARPHVAAASFVLLAVCAAVHLRRHGGWRAYVFAGLAAGLAVGALQNGIAAFGPIAVALILRWRADRARVLVGGLVVLTIAGLFVVWLYPFLFASADAGGVGVDEQGTLGLSRHKIFLGLFNGGGFMVVWRSLVDYDPVLTCGAILGLVAAISAPLVLRGRFGRERALDLAVVLAYALPYFVVIGLYQRTYQRFALPLVPFLAILAAFGLFVLWWALRSAARPLGLFAAGLAVLVATAQFAWCWRIGSVRASTDTIAAAAHWLEQNAQPDSDEIDVMPGLDMPLKRTPDSVAHGERMQDEQSLPWFRHLWETPTSEIEAPAYDLRWMDLFAEATRKLVRSDPGAFVQALTGRYAVTVVWPQKYRPALRAVRDGLAANARRGARFSPDDPGVDDDIPLVHQDDELPEASPWAWRALHAGCVGPTIEIYRLR